MNNLQNQNKSSKRTTTLKVIIIALALVLVSGIGYGSWKILTKSKPRPLPEEPFTEPTTSEPTIQPESENLTANWKTYRNEKYGFEVKYPKDWRTLHEGYYKKGIPYEVSFAPSNLKGPYAAPIGILIHTEGLENVSRAGRYVEIKHEEKIIINNLTSKKQICTGPEGEFEVILIPKEEKLTYGLSYSNPEFKDTFHQMLSTFKFIK